MRISHTWKRKQIDDGYQALKQKSRRKTERSLETQKKLKKRRNTKWDKHITTKTKLFIGFSKNSGVIT